MFNLNGMDFEMILVRVDPGPAVAIKPQPTMQVVFKGTGELSRGGAIPLTEDGTFADRLAFLLNHLVSFTADDARLAQDKGPDTPSVLPGGNETQPVGQQLDEPSRIAEGNQESQPRLLGPGGEVIKQEL